MKTNASVSPRGSTLTLTRRVGERVHVGDGLIVEVGEVRGSMVRLRFHTPAGAEPLPIYRAEIAPGAGTGRAKRG